eukprot:CAMPEP_0119536112 /NCGR_PEP_ID=MMETSP1344-20130328/49027_1 /TAXON_ID=236787 /ORGANISM="Florenciella parvula, Strain CCMP2471" /LENGTH=65 /DNA_ID=CAMNT_0007578027 /DNA_START=14 /DNA_END=211 /DNA_ORIENTATION=-
MADASSQTVSEVDVVVLGGKPRPVVRASQQHASAAAHPLAPDTHHHPRRHQRREHGVPPQDEVPG